MRIIIWNDMPSATEEDVWSAAVASVVEVAMVVVVVVIDVVVVAAGVGVTVRVSKASFPVGDLAFVVGAVGWLVPRE